QHADLTEVPLRARMQRNGRVDAVFRHQLQRHRMHGVQRRRVFINGLHDLIRQIVGHGTMGHDDVGVAQREHVVVHAPVRARRDDRAHEVRMRLDNLVQHLGLQRHQIDIAHLRDLLHRRARIGEVQEDGVHDAVHQRVCGLVLRQARPRHVAVGINAERFENGQRDGLRAAARGLGGHPLAAQVVDGLDARLLQHDQMLRRRVHLKFRKMASTMRSTSASADSFCDRRARVMSRSGSMPNVSRMASAMVSAPLPGASVDTRLPRRSLTDLMPDSFSTTKCCGAGYIWNSATISSGCSKGGRPWCALYATLPSTMPISDKPLPTRRAFSTDAAVDSAVTMTPGMWRDKRSAIAPPSGKYTPPGPPVDRLRNRVCAPAAAANTPTISKAANTTDRLRTFDLCTLSTSCSVLIPRQRQQATFPKGIPLRRIPPIDVLGTV